MRKENHSMNEQKQIEEMARDICKLGISCEECTMLARKTNQTREQYCKAFEYAKRAYNAGYRKQSVGEWVKGSFNNTRTCSICGNVNTFRSKFCPNCGAKMKGGEE